MNTLKLLPWQIALLKTLRDHLAEEGGPPPKTAGEFINSVSQATQSGGALYGLSFDVVEYATRVVFV